MSCCLFVEDHNLLNCDHSLKETWVYDSRFKNTTYLYLDKRFHELICNKFYDFLHEVFQFNWTDEPEVQMVV